MATGSATAAVREENPSATNQVPAKSRTLTFLAFFSIYFIWGSTYLAIRYAVETIPPLYTAGLRHFVPRAIVLFGETQAVTADNRTVLQYYAIANAAELPHDGMRMGKEVVTNLCAGINGHETV